jgi:hypothetical protein
MESATTASQRRDMHACVRGRSMRVACRYVYVRARDLPDSSSVQASARRPSKRTQETDARYPACLAARETGSSFSLRLAFHAASDATHHAYHILHTASQPASLFLLRCTALHCAALRCTALHTAFFGSLFGSISQPRLILPYLCGLATLACMPACLTFLFLVQAPGSEVGKYSRTYADSLGLRSLDGLGST